MVVIEMEEIKNMKIVIFLFFIRIINFEEKKWIFVLYENYRDSIRYNGEKRWNLKMGKYMVREIRLVGGYRNIFRNLRLGLVRGFFLIL